LAERSKSNLSGIARGGDKSVGGTNKYGEG